MSAEHAKAVDRARRAAARALIVVNGRLGEPIPADIREAAETDR